MVAGFPWYSGTALPKLFPSLSPVTDTSHHGAQHADLLVGHLDLNRRRLRGSLDRDHGLRVLKSRRHVFFELPQDHLTNRVPLGSGHALDVDSTDGMRVRR